MIIIINVITKMFFKSVYENQNPKLENISNAHLLPKFLCKYKPIPNEIGKINSRG